MRMQMGRRAVRIVDLSLCLSHSLASGVFLATALGLGSMDRCIRSAADGHWQVRALTVALALHRALALVGVEGTKCIQANAVSREGSTDQQRRLGPQLIHTIATSRAGNPSRYPLTYRSRLCRRSRRTLRRHMVGAQCLFGWYILGQKHLVAKPNRLLRPLHQSQHAQCRSWADSGTAPCACGINNKTTTPRRLPAGPVVTAAEDHSLEAVLGVWRFDNSVSDAATQVCGILLVGCLWPSQPPPACFGIGCFFPHHCFFHVGYRVLSDVVPRLPSLSFFFASWFSLSPILVEARPSPPGPCLEDVDRRDLGGAHSTTRYQDGHEKKKGRSVTSGRGLAVAGATVRGWYLHFPIDGG